MQLLSPSQVKERKKDEHLQKALEAQKISLILKTGLKELENFKKLKAKEVSEAEEYAAKRKAQIAEELRLEEDKVKVLERRKESALRPVKELMKEAEGLIEANRLKEEELIKRESILEKKSLEVYAFAERIEDREDELKEREREVSIAAQKNRDESERVAESLMEVNQRWADLHVSVGEASRALLGRETRVAQAEKANEVTKNSLLREEERLNNYKVQLLDERGVLDRAWDELKIKQQNNGRSETR